MDKKTAEKLKEKLESEKVSIEKELNSFAKEDQNRKSDWDTRYPKFDSTSLETEADEMQEYEKLLSVEHSLELRLKDINIALEKIKKGKYGICENCEKEIDEKRLQACPEARICIKCK